MDFLKNLESFDIEKVVQSLDEFPERQPLATPATQGVLTAAAVDRARNAHHAWQEIDLEGHRTQWEALLSSPSSSSDLPALKQVLAALLAAPDPVAAFEASASLSARILDVEGKNRQLSAAAAAASADETEVRQLVEAHRLLQAEHKELQEKLQQLTSESEAHRALAEAAEKLRADLAAERADSTKLQGLLKSLREEHERSQSALFEATLRSEEELGARQREMDVVAADLEAAQKTVAELQQAVRELTTKPASEKHSWESAEAAEAPAGDPFWEHQLSLKDKQLESLHQQLEAMAIEAASQKAESEAATTQAVADAKQLQFRVGQLTAELDKCLSPQQCQEMLLRLTALEALVDTQMEAEGWDRAELKALLDRHLLQLGGAGPPPPATSGILQERNRKLASELASVRREMAEQKVETEQTQAQLRQACEERQQLQQLVSRLEEDLLRMSSRPLSSAGPGAKAPSSDPDVGGVDADAAAATAAAALASTPRDAGPRAADGPDMHTARGNNASLVAGPIEVAPVRPGTPDNGRSAEERGTVAQQGGLLDIVVGQRNRLRQQVSVLEEEKGQLLEQAARLQRDLDGAKADNLTMYEKLRYLERYSQQQQHALAGGAEGTVSVIKVDDAGVASAGQDASARRGTGRYRCGPLAIDLGAGAGHGGASGTSQQSGGGRAARERVRRVAMRGLAACFPQDDQGPAAGGDEESAQGPTPAEAKYAHDYESRINPFTQFQRQETEARVQRLQLHDRAVLAGSKLLAGSKVARIFVAVYACLLHAFVLLMLYYLLSFEGGVTYIETTVSS